MKLLNVKVAHSFAIEIIKQSIITSYIFTVCHTEEGTPCIFPFKHKDKWYNECTKDDHSESKFWCSTKVDENGNHDKEWGNCADNCSNEGGGMLFITQNPNLFSLVLWYP